MKFRIMIADVVKKREGQKNLRPGSQVFFLLRILRTGRLIPLQVIVIAVRPNPLIRSPGPISGYIQSGLYEQSLV